MHAFKGYPTAYNVEVLNSFRPELQLKDTESAIRNGLIDLLIEFKSFKFVATLVLVFKKMESEQQKQLLMKVTLMMYLNQSITQFYQIYNFFFWKRFRLNYSKHNPLAGSSYIKLPKELHHPNKGLINI